MNLFGLFKKPKVEYRVIPRDIQRMKLDEWRQTPHCVNLAKKFLNDPEFRMLLDVVKNEHPGRYALSSESTLEERAIMQAKTEGFMLALNRLEATAEPFKLQPQIEATYEPPEDELEPDNKQPR